MDEIQLPLSAQQRRKLQRKLRELKCPGCREKALYWGTARGTVACGSCAVQRSPADLGLEWHAGLEGRSSYWTTERERAERRRVYREWARQPCDREVLSVSALRHRLDLVCEDETDEDEETET